MTFLLYCGFLLLPFITGMFAGSKYQPMIQMIGAAFNIGSGITWAIVFLAMAPKTSSKFVFTEFINTSGWSNDAWVFILSFYTPSYGLYGTDGVMHCKIWLSISLILSSQCLRADISILVAEEMKNPSRDGPLAMVWSMVWAGATAFLSAIVMCYTVGPDWKSRLSHLSSYLSWFMDVTGSVYGGGIFCAIIMMGLNVSDAPVQVSVFSNRTVDTHSSTVLDHFESIHSQRSIDLEDGN
jgi:choline transport protein